MEKIGEKLKTLGIKESTLVKLYPQIVVLNRLKWNKIHQLIIKTQYKAFLEHCLF